MKIRSGAFSATDIKAFEPEAKVGLLATINPRGLPHLTLITSLQAKDPRKLMWGQFTEGLSKAHVRQNPRTAFAVLTLDKKLWRGKALWTGAVQDGEDYRHFNSLPLFRYNAYFGIHTVHYMDLVSTTGREKLPLPAIVAATLLTRLLGFFAGSGSRAVVLKPWARSLFNGMDTLKFLSYIGADGFPEIIPVLPGKAADGRRLVFSPLAYGGELREIPEGAPVAVLALSLQMEDCLVRGALRRRVSGMPLMAVDIDWVYNSMPPNPGQIYPELPLVPVTRF